MLIEERKPVGSDWQTRLARRDQKLCNEAFVNAWGVHGNLFRIVLRANIQKPEDFSAILVVFLQGKGRPIRLRRYNGPHRHHNTQEAGWIAGCHIHKATQRYQESGLEEDGYAVQTDRFADLEGARACLFEDCAIITPPDSQQQIIPRASS